MASSSINRFLIAFTFFLVAAGEKCEDTSYRTNLNEISIGSQNGETLSTEYSCPREFDPLTYTKCCDEGCCEEFKIAPSAQMTAVRKRTIAAIVMSLCLVLSVGIVICCFWSLCPFYCTCQPDHNLADLVLYRMCCDHCPPSCML